MSNRIEPDNSYFQWSTPGKYKQLETVLEQWQAAVNKKHTEAGFTHPADYVHAHIGHDYIRLDIGSSGAFMVHIDTGLIYGIKGYGKVNKKKISGDLFSPNFDASVLVRDRFRYGNFINKADGTPDRMVR